MGLNNLHKNIMKMLDKIIVMMKASNLKMKPEKKIRKKKVNHLKRKIPKRRMIKKRKSSMTIYPLVMTKRLEKYRKIGDLLLERMHIGKMLKVKLIYQSLSKPQKILVLSSLVLVNSHLLKKNSWNRSKRCLSRNFQMLSKMNQHQEVSLSLSQELALRGGDPVLC